MIPMSKPRTRPWVGAGIILAVLAGAGWLLFRSTVRRPEVPDARFVATSYPTSGPGAGSTWKDRVFLTCLDLMRRYQRPNPAGFSFPAQPTTRCLVHGLLNQCMEITGVRYVLPREVAAGTFEFGHTNTLNGAQWASAVTDALQGGRVEWWDSQAGRFSREPLVFLTNGPRTVLILPRALVPEFRR